MRNSSPLKQPYSDQTAQSSGNGIAARARSLIARQERGIALLATLLAIALMTLLVIDFTTSAALGYRSAANQANQLRAYYLARSGIQVGLAVIAHDSLGKSALQEQFDSLDQGWAQPIAPIAVDGGTVSMSIVDEARKININKVFDQQKNAPSPIFAGIFARLLTELNLPPEFLPVLIDWLDPDSIESDHGAEADYYLRLTPPYEPRNGPMPTIGDLRMLKGMDDVTFMRLSQYLTTMQEGSGFCCVNVNTAPPEVLAALAPELENNPELVKQIVDVRQIRPFTKTTDLLNLPGISGIEQHLNPFISTSSHYFTITSQGDFAGARKRIYATFRRNMNGTGLLMSWHED